MREDPDFALAHAGLADARLVLAIYGVRAPIDVIPGARADAERALALRADSAEALAARASVRALYDENWEGAERDYLAALAAHEQYATAHQWFAMHLLGPRGRFAEARVRLARARELDPLSAAIGASAGLLRYYERDHEQALVEFALVLERHPQFSLAHLGRGLTLSALGRHRDAIEALRAATLFSASSPEAVSALAFAQARGGEVAAAREGLAALGALAATRYVSATLLAQVHAGLDEVAPALDRLEQARAARATDLSFLGHRPTFDSLRAESRFRLLVT